MSFSQRFEACVVLKQLEQTFIKLVTFIQRAFGNPEPANPEPRVVRKI